MHNAGHPFGLHCTRCPKIKRFLRIEDNTLYTDLNERESREMKTCDEHFHFYDILLCDFETKPTKKH